MHLEDKDQGFSLENVTNSRTNLDVQPKPRVGAQGTFQKAHALHHFLALLPRCLRVLVAVFVLLFVLLFGLRLLGHYAGWLQPGPGNRAFLECIHSIKVNYFQTFSPKANDSLYT